MNNLYEEITNAIIDQLEKGHIPWRKPWIGTGSAISHETGKPYSMLNQLLKRPGEYITFLQVQKEGGRVKKGEKASHVYFWKMLRKPELDDDGNPILDAEGKQRMKTIPILKCYSVFHIDQCEGIKPKFDIRPAVPADPDAAAEKVLTDYVQRERIRLDTTGSGQAYYAPLFDMIVLPNISQYSSAAEYYSTAFHEAVHSTGHKRRLNRFPDDGKCAAFGSEDYSKEELVAEIGAACLVHKQGLETPESFKNSAAYIQSWLKKLRDDKNMIIGAASKAEKAVKFILNEQANEAPAEATEA